MAMIHSFFVSQKGLQTDEECQKYAEWMLECNRFVYAKANQDVKRVMSSLVDAVTLRMFIFTFSF